MLRSIIIILVGCIAGAYAKFGNLRLKKLGLASKDKLSNDLAANQTCPDVVASSSLSKRLHGLLLVLSFLADRGRPLTRHVKAAAVNVLLSMRALLLGMLVTKAQQPLSNLKHENPVIPASEAPELAVGQLHERPTGELYEARDTDVLPELWRAACGVCMDDTTTKSHNTHYDDDDITFQKVHGVVGDLLKAAERHGTENEHEQNNREADYVDCTMRGFVNLAECRSSPEGGTLLAAALESLCTKWSGDESCTRRLQLLNLGRNRIGERGVQHLCRAVNPNRRPHRLELVRTVLVYCNVPSFSWFGAFFSAILRGMPHLDVVDLGGMHVGDRAADLMAQVVHEDVPEGRYLRELHLDFLGLTSQSVPKLLYIIQSLRVICIFLEGNAIGEDDLYLMEKACRKNRVTWQVDPPPVTLQNIFAPGKSSHHNRIYSMLNPGTSFADKVAASVLQNFLLLIPPSFLNEARGQLVVAGFVSYDEPSKQFKVLSLGTGTSSVSYPGVGFSMDELALDSHAEILAHQALLAHCYYQHNARLPQIHDATKQLYFYTSTAPCGYTKDGKEIGKDRKEFVEGCANQRRSCLGHIRIWMNSSGDCAGDHPFRLPISGIVVGRKYKAWCEKEGFVKTAISLESILSEHYGAKLSSAYGDSDASWYWFKVPAKHNGDEDELRGFSEFLDGRVGRRMDGRMSRISGSLLASV